MALAPGAHAENECGTAVNPVCTSSGNPYASGIGYNAGAGSRSITLASDASVEPTTLTAVPGQSGMGFGVTEGSAGLSPGTYTILIEAGASVSGSLPNVIGAHARKQSINFTNHGDITLTGSGSRGIVLISALNSSGYQITLTSTGTVSAVGDAVRLGAGGSNTGPATVNNSGRLSSSGSGRALHVNGNFTNVTVNQSGEVDSNGDFGLGVFNASGTATVNNTGTITGLSGAVLFTGVVRGTLTNSGTITGTGAATNGVLGNARVGVSYVNAGLIEGATGVQLSNAAQNLLNSGTIHGRTGYAVRLVSAGNTLTLRTGSTLVGDVVATAANNKVVLEGTGMEDSNFLDIAQLELDGASWTLGGNLTTNGALADATRIDAGTLIVTGPLTNTNGGVTIANGGTLQLGNGGLVAFDASVSPFDGQIQLHGIDIGPLGITNDGTLRFDHETPGFFFDTPITGGGAIDVAQGTTRLTGDSSAFTGATDVAGHLIVHGTLGGSVDVAPGGALSGTGTVGAVVIGAGGTLASRDADVLSMQSLTLDAGSHIAVELGAPSSVALFDVAGNVLLDGTLDVDDAGGFGVGTTRLIDYGGTLTYNGLDIGRTPDGMTASDLAIQTSVANQVNLVSTAGRALDFWDGNGGQNDSVISGGSGTWNATNTQWTTADGALNGASQQGFAIFQGVAGTVTVDGTGGTVSAAGLQFASDGYALAGDALALYAPETVVRVGDGTAAGAAFVATIDAALTGAASLVKRDFGTLVLNGTNTYTGGTQLRGGTVQVASDASLGDVAGGLIFDNARLATTGDMTSSRAITFEGNGGVFDSLTGTTLTLTGNIGGTGDLGKMGAGTLVLDGANSYAGDTLVFSGTLVGDAGSIRGRIASSGTTVFDQGVDGVFAGDIGGTGTMIKRGAGALTLGGVDSLDWSIGEGTLASSASRFTGNVAIGEAGTLRFDEATDAAYDGLLSGTGTFAKSGAGRLMLSQDASAFAGATQLQGGTLRVDGALGGAIRVASGATLEGTGTVGTTTFAGRIAPGDGTAHTGTLTVNGDLVAQGGTIRIGAILAGDGSPTSKLHVTGNSSGNGFIDVQHLGGAGARTGDGILLVSVDGTSAASFTLLGRVVAGPYDYTLYQGSRSNPANGDWYLRSQLTVRPEPAAYLANQGAAFRMFRHGLDDRTGAARERGAWLRTQGATLDETLDSGRLALDQAHSLVQAGVDMWDFGNGMVGAMLGAGRADASIVAPSSGYHARAESRGESVGVYATWFEHADAPVGAYMDAWLQYGRYDHRTQGAFLAIEKYDAYATTASFESGYGVRIANGKSGALFITPEAQIAWTGYRGKDHVERNGTIVQAGDEAIVTRLGAKLHADTTLGRVSVRPYLAADWHHGAGDANAMTFDGVRLEGATPADRYTAKLGAQADFGAGWSASAEAEHAWGDGDYRELGAQLAVRYRW